MPRIPVRSAPAAHCHKLVAETARALAGQLYETMMGDNEVFAKWKQDHEGLNSPALEAAFIDRYWGMSIPAARATLAQMLRGPYEDVLKDEIKDALILDATLIRGRH